MQHIKWFFFILLSFSVSTTELTKSELNKIRDNDVLAKSTVETSKDDKEQTLAFRIVGLHPKSCRFALRKLSLYEKYSVFLDFVKKSQYDDKQKRIYLKLSHTLLPFDMGLNFILPRIEKPGKYPFEFDRGFLKGLKGMINISKFEGRCLFETTADWKGKNTGINDTIFELFSTTLSKASMETLFRISSTY